MWKADIENTRMKLGRKGILDEAFYNYKVLYMDYKLPTVMVVKYLRDPYGKIGINLGDYNLVAKDTPYGNIVSVNEKVWRSRKPIIMYLRSNHSFYLFKQKEITGTVANMRGDVKMINFSISYGVNIKKVFEERTEEEKFKKRAGY